MLLNGGPEFRINPSISLFVQCNSIKETDETWKHLSNGGKILMELNEYPWSKRYGWVQDKFGMTWQIMLNDAKGASGSIVPSLLFTSDKFGKAEEAMKSYCSLFENSAINGITLYPKGDANEGKVMFAEFSLNNYPLIAMDGPGEHAYSFNEGVSFVVNCDSQNEIDHFWNELTKGGEENRCGWLKDKFGVSWQIIPSILGKLMSDPEKAPGVINAFMKMKKFEIEKLLQV